MKPNQQPRAALLLQNWLLYAVFISVCLNNFKLKTMKVKEKLNLAVLLKYGFTKINKEEETENEQYTIASYNYKFEIGHARRGQFYYLLVGEKTRDVIIYATEPDGSGGSVICPNVLIKLFLDGVVS